MGHQALEWHSSIWSAACVVQCVPWWLLLYEGWGAIVGKQSTHSRNQLPLLNHWDYLLKVYCEVHE